MFRNLFARSQPSRQEPPSAASCLETLESRTLFSFGVDPSGQLFVTGTYGDDWLQVVWNGRGTPSTSDDLIHAHITFEDGSYVNGDWPAAQISRVVLIGGPGNDDLDTGCPLPVTIYGDEGDDHIHGGWGQCYLVGGPGNDIISGGVSLDVLYGGDGDDILSGGGGPDILYGDAGNDILHGNEGDDHLHGGVGNDQLFGDAGIDRLYGDDGNDRLDTGADSDNNEIAYGGNGLDIFKYRPGDHTDRMYFELMLY